MPSGVVQSDGPAIVGLSGWSWSLLVFVVVVVCGGCGVCGLLVLLTGGVEVVVGGVGGGVGVLVGGFGFTTSHFLVFSLNSVPLPQSA